MILAIALGRCFVAQLPFGLVPGETCARAVSQLFYFMGYCATRQLTPRARCKIRKVAQKIPQPVLYLASKSTPRVGLSAPKSSGTVGRTQESVQVTTIVTQGSQISPQ
jgi:hypothetical protein